MHTCYNLRSIRRGIPFFFFITLAGKGYAQLGPASLNGPGIAVSADYLPSSHYIRPEDSVKTGSTTSQRRYNFGAGFNIFNHFDTATKKINSLSVKMAASYTQLENKDYEEQIFPKELLSATVAFQYYRSMRNRWAMMGIAGVSLGTDLEDINGQDIFVQGGVLFIKTKNQHFSYGFGAVLTNTFGTPMVLPGFYIGWQTGNKYRIDIQFPEKASISTTLNKYTDLALALRITGATYDISHYVNNKRLMGSMQMTTGLENTWHLTKHLDATIAGGVMFLNSVNFSEKKLSEMFKDKPQYRLGSNYYLSTGLRWNFAPRK